VEPKKIPRAIKAENEMENSGAIVTESSTRAALLTGLIGSNKVKGNNDEHDLVLKLFKSHLSVVNVGIEKLVEHLSILTWRWFRSIETLLVEILNIKEASKSNEMRERL